MVKSPMMIGSTSPTAAALRQQVMSLDRVNATIISGIKASQGHATPGYYWFNRGLGSSSRTAIWSCVELLHTYENTYLGIAHLSPSPCLLSPSSLVRLVLLVLLILFLLPLSLVSLSPPDPRCIRSAYAGDGTGSAGDHGQGGDLPERA